MLWVWVPPAPSSLYEESVLFSFGDSSLLILFKGHFKWVGVSKWWNGVPCNGHASPGGCHTPCALWDGLQGPHKPWMDYEDGWISNCARSPVFGKSRMASRCLCGQILAGLSLDAGTVVCLMLFSCFRVPQGLVRKRGTGVTEAKRDQMDSR